ncbi:MAG: glycosyltransferase family 2 protein [Anaerolineaceae bacterium]|nr:glycosyltransferase family 2 protein [Anaerolineaceae bacterium]
MLPKISIVTPSFNQVDFLEATIRSVLDQKYPNLEYIIVDGGSTDGSVDIIRRYASHLHWWVSEPDKGQYDAINKGFQHSSGEIMAWLNSDDLYFQWTLSTVAKLFSLFPTVRWLSGGICFANNLGQVTGTGVIEGGISRELLLKGCYRKGLATYLPQEGMFWRRSLWDQCESNIDTQYQLAADFDLWCRFAKFAQPVAVRCLFSVFRRHFTNQRSFSLNDKYIEETELICKSLPSPPIIWKLIGKNTLLNLLYCLFFVHGSSKSIFYNENKSKWDIQEVGNKPLYRPIVVKRKI